MTPVEICDLLDRLAGWPWPLTPAATQARLVVELGYDLIPTPMGTMTVKNRAVGDGDAEVLVPRASKHGRVAFGVKFDATDDLFDDRSPAAEASAAICTPGRSPRGRVAGAAPTCAASPTTRGHCGCCPAGAHTWCG